MTLLVLFGVALLARVVSGLAFPDPAYPDSYYYVNLARQLAEGNGFQVDYIWSFVEVGGVLPAEPRLPIPSNAHWMPLAALIQVPFIWLLGPTAVASALPFWLIGAAAAPLTYVIGRDAGVARTGAVSAAVLVAVPGAVTPFLSQPDNFALYMTLGALALWLCARGLRGDRRAYVIGGAAVGLATLARSDGVLLGVPFALVAASDLLRPPRWSRIVPMAAVACLVLFTLVVGPWVLRQLAVFGSISPSAASGRILWIADYRELYSISGPQPTLQSFLAQGVEPLIASRIGGLMSAVGIFVLWPLVLVLAPAALIGAWQRRAAPHFAPFFVYAALLFAVSALLFAVHVPHGTFIHSAVALLPHTYLLVAVGIAATVRSIAARRPSWEEAQATFVFSAGAVILALVLGVAQTAATHARWAADRQARVQLAGQLASVPATDVLMSPDAGGYRYWAGLSGIVTPDDPLPVIESAMRAYGVRWLALESGHMVPALTGVLTGESRPDWIVAVPPIEGATGATPGALPPPPAALFAVCLEPADERCAP